MWYSRLSIRHQSWWAIGSIPCPVIAMTWKMVDLRPVQSRASHCWVSTRNYVVLPLTRHHVEEHILQKQPRGSRRKQVEVVARRPLATLRKEYKAKYKRNWTELTLFFYIHVRCLCNIHFYLFRYYALKSDKFNIALMLIDTVQNETDEIKVCTLKVLELASCQYNNYYISKS